MRGEQKKKIRKIKFGNYRSCKFGPHYLLAQQASLRQYIGAAQVYPSFILQQISWALFAAFCLFGRTLPIDFALLGRKRKYIKSRTTAKLTEKRTSIAAVRDILWMFGTFPTPFLSRYRLPLRKKKIGEVFRCDSRLSRKICIYIKLNKFNPDPERWLWKIRGNMFPFTLTFKINQLWLSDMDTLRRYYEPGV